jgi:phosphatidylserine/phosphatidylglycerophosphate/cardiolipin synthase-like enzyme
VPCALCAALLLAGVPLTALAQEEAPPLEFVESVPVETSLDDPAIRNTLPVWLELIAGARRTLDIEQFYISPQPGEALDRVLAAVRAAAGRGVRVRVIVDARMHRTYPHAPSALDSVEGMDVRVLDFRPVAGGIQHAKFFIVDGRVTFLGSQNFDWRALTHIRELGLIVRDESTTAVYARVFETDWRIAGGAAPQEAAAALRDAGAVRTRTVPLPEGGEAELFPTVSPLALHGDSAIWDETAMLTLVAEATREVFLQFLSYGVRSRDGTRWTLLDDALRAAAARGVDVRLVVADWGKGTPAEEAVKELAGVPGIRVRYSVIPEWSGGYVSYARVEHCKYILADGTRFWLGTSNAEKSYFHTSRNLGIVARSAQLGGRLRDFFLRGWDSPYGEPLVPGRTYAPRKHDGE